MIESKIEEKSTLVYVDEGFDEVNSITSDNNDNGKVPKFSYTYRLICMFTPKVFLCSLIRLCKISSLALCMESNLE